MAEERRGGAAAHVYRQEQEWTRQGLKLSRQTMSNWVLRAAEDHLLPVYEELRRQLVKREVLHADETTLQVLHEPGKKAQIKSCMWMYRTGWDGGGPPIVLYEYQPSRKAEHAAKFLNGFSGFSVWGRKPNREPSEAGRGWKGGARERA